MARYGITIPLARPLAEQRHYIESLIDDGYTDLWSSETAGTDAFVPIALASVWAPTARLGCAIVPAFTRGPALLAQSVAAMATAAPGRFVFGIGASSDVIVGRWNGLPFERPLARTRDMVEFLKAALGGEKVTREFETFTVDGFRLDAVPETPPPIVVGALRPRMLEMAGAVADGAVVNWLSAEDVATVAPIVRAGGPDKEVAARIFVCPSTDTDAVREQGRRFITAYLNVPVYRKFHEWLGRDELRPMWDAWAAGDRKAALAAVPDHVVDDLIVHGSPEACREHIGRYVDNGVDTPVLGIMPWGVEPVEAAHLLAPA